MASSDELHNRVTDTDRDSKSVTSPENTLHAMQKRVMFPDTCDHSAGDEALVEVCSLMNDFLGEVGTMDSATPCPGADSSQDESCQNQLSKARIIIAALHVMRASFKLSTQSGKAGLAKRLEPALRELVINDGCYGLLSAAARARVRAAALETYDVGIEIFFSSPVQMVQALRQMLPRVDIGEESHIERDMCSRCDGLFVCACVCVFVCTAQHNLNLSLEALNDKCICITAYLDACSVHAP
jgi:hypothetical protein